MIFLEYIMLSEVEFRIATYIHPVHAVLPLADLEHDSVTLLQFFELLDGVGIDDRYAFVNIIAPFVGLKRTKPQTELDLQLRRCRHFKEACMRIDTDASRLIRDCVEMVFDTLFLIVWKKTATELSANCDIRSAECLSCSMETFEKKMKELWRSEDRDSHLRIVSLRQYLLFGEQVAGPLIGYC